MFLACLFDDEWQALCRTIARPHLLDDPRFATGEARQQYDDALAGELAAIFATEDPDALGRDAHCRGRGLRQGRGQGDVLLFQR